MYGVDPILVININVDLSQTEVIDPDKDLAAIIAVEGLKYMTFYFRTLQGVRYRRTWRMVWRHQ